MPRGKKKPAPRKTPTHGENVMVFADRVEQATPKWLDGFMDRQRVLIERFHDKDDDGKFTASVSEQAQIHKVLTLSESSMMRIAVVREQIAKDRGVSNFMEREGTRHNHLTLNFAPGTTPEERAYAERLFLATFSGKEVEAQPVLVLPAVAESSKEDAA